MYLCKFSSNFRKNWSAGNSLEMKDHLVLSVDGGGAVIVSEMAMCDRGECWVAKYSLPWHTIVCHGWLEGLPPKISCL
jgi:hypothetical protein